jgi:hypothetical protein
VYYLSFDFGFVVRCFCFKIFENHQSQTAILAARAILNVNTAIVLQVSSEKRYVNEPGGNEKFLSPQNKSSPQNKLVI